MSYRESVQIRGYIGANGVGKTLLAVRDALRTGMPVYSTVRIDHELFRPIRSFPELLDAHDGVVLLDEVQAIASSRQSQGMPPEVLTFLLQLRKRNVRLIWTTPAWGRADVALREVTMTVTRIRGFFFRDNGTLWPSPRLMRATTYDAVSLQNATQDKIDNFDDARVLETRFYWASALYSHAPYRTGEQVFQIAPPSGGTCAVCGGTRQRPKCRCGEDHPAPDAHGRGELSGSTLLDVAMVRPVEGGQRSGRLDGAHRAVR